MAVEQQHLEIFRHLFIHRQDCYAQQTSKGAYLLKRELLTDAVLRAHLEGRLTLGLYALSPFNTVRWVCLDADREDGLAQLQAAWTQLGQRGIAAQLEGSRRGGHLWIPFEPIGAHVARRLILGILPNLEGTEVFPKQNHIGEGQVGSLVRGPLGEHLLTGCRYPFLDPLSLQPITRSVQATLEYLQSVPRFTNAQVAEELAALLDEATRPAPDSVPITPRPERLPGARLSPIQQLKERIGDPYAFISQFVELDAQGRGHCPLHPPDLHPSFVFDRRTGHFTCFVRRVGSHRIPFVERRGEEEVTSGSTAYLAAKANGDHSMPSKREGDRRR